MDYLVINHLGIEALSMNTISNNLISVSKRICNAALKSGRRPEDITLVCVSKNHSIHAIMTAVKCGYANIGESYLNEALEKQNSLIDETIEWHFIGTLQSNKCNQVSRNFNWVHSVSSLKSLRKLNACRDEKSPPLNILLQINVDNEESKSGFLYKEIKSAIKEVTTLDRINLRGFMAIPKNREDYDSQIQVYKVLQDFSKKMQQNFPELLLDCLSIGMSGDLEAAIECGATHVRVGTDIFGYRDYSAMMHSRSIG